LAPAFNFKLDRFVTVKVSDNYSAQPSLKLKNLPSLQQISKSALVPSNQKLSTVKKCFRQNERIMLATKSTIIGGAMTHSMITFSIMTFRTTTLNIMTLYITTNES